jgi:hypothetical protein
MFMDLIYHIEDLAYRIFQLTEAIKELRGERAGTTRELEEARSALLWFADIDNDGAETPDFARSALTSAAEAARVAGGNSE